MAQAFIFVVACQLVRRADEEDLVPLALHGLAGVALPAAAVLRLDNHPLVVLYVAAQLAQVVLVLDAQFVRQIIGLGDIYIYIRACSP